MVRSAYDQSIKWSHLTATLRRRWTKQGIEHHADAEHSEASGTNTHTIPDRAEAIRFAINLAGENDTVLIAGKGHEDYQIIGKTKHHFDDREQAAAALRDKLN